MNKRPTENLSLSEEYRSLGPSVSDLDSNKRLDFYLSSNYPFYSRSLWKKKIQSGELLVNGKKVRASYTVKEGDTLQKHHPRQKEPSVDTNIYPLFQEDGVMALFKPGNIPMHESGPYRFNTFAHIVGERFGEEWSSIHRLDRETSGIVLCGSTKEIRQKLSADLMAGSISKEYIAVVRGEPKEDSFKEFGPIGDLEESDIRIKKWVVPDGLPSETWFDVIGRKNGYAMLRAQPKTGRTNQIRIHAAYNGLILVGDKLYHPDEGIFIEYFENRGNTDNIVEKTGHYRHCLHASQLKFVHPKTGVAHVVSCPVPEDMQSLWDSYGDML